MHRVVVHASFHAHRNDGHNVRVVKCGGRLGFVPEPLQLPLVQDSGQGQDLEGNSSSKRDLLGLVDHAHATPSYFANDAEIAQEPPLFARWFRGVAILKRCEEVPA